MKSTHHLLIALIACILLMYHYKFNYCIMDTEYMFFLTTFLLGILGWNAGVGIAKLIKEIR